MGETIKSSTWRHRPNIQVKLNSYSRDGRLSRHQIMEFSGILYTLRAFPELSLISLKFQNYCFSSSLRSEHAKKIMSEL